MIKKQSIEHMRYVVTMCFVIVVVVSTTADDVSVKKDRFALWNECETMDLVVEDPTEDYREIGLTRDSLTVAARSRLRSARLYKAESNTYLYINVLIVGQAFKYDVSFNKFLYDVISGEFGWAQTWRKGGGGTHGGDASFVLSQVSQKVDMFLDEYLRINEEAC